MSISGIQLSGHLIKVCCLNKRTMPSICKYSFREWQGQGLKETSSLGSWLFRACERGRLTGFGRLDGRVIFFPSLPC